MLKMIFGKIINDIDNQIEIMNEELLLQIEAYFEEKEKQKNLLKQIENVIGEYELNSIKDESEKRIDKINKDKRIIELTIYKLKNLKREIQQENESILFLDMELNC